MRLDECYRLLDLQPGVSAEELKRAHRDLTKVWHPDRFGHDAGLRKKAEEKLKAINEAYETILASGPGQYRRHQQHHEERKEENEASAWRVRWRGHEARVPDLQAIVTLVGRGALGEDAEIYDPAAARWIPLVEFPELLAILQNRRVRRSRGYALTCAAIAIFILLRRPTPAGLVIALVLFAVAFVFITRMRIKGGNASRQ